MKKKLDKASIVLVQKHQVDQSQIQLGKTVSVLSELEDQSDEHNMLLDEMISIAEGLQNNSEHLDVDIVAERVAEMEDVFASRNEDSPRDIPLLSHIEALEVSSTDEWEDYVSAVKDYADRHEIDLTKDPFDSLMTDRQRAAIEKRINDEFTLKTANCDNYDYMIAGTCGLVGGLVDVIFVGQPGQSKLGDLSDNAVDNAVERFAALVGWSGPKEGSDSTQSAIGFLERKYKINYDHRHGADVDGRFRMSTKNHHVKNLGHSPDLVGLFFSILGQFTNTAHFIDSGKIISVDTDNFELQGTNLASKVFSGFTNWLGHLFSDVAGSSGAQGRGSGIPIPFFSLLQTIDIGSFGQHRQTFAQISVQVFEQGYDFRHGLAMAIPVMLAELLTRVMWTFKQRFYHDRPWKECIPTAGNPELRRMLLVAHGVLCIVDAGDAALRSGGEIIQFMLRSNMIAWVRFGSLALKEITVWYKAGSLDVDATNEYIELEYKRILEGIS